MKIIRRRKCAFCDFRCVRWNVLFSHVKERHPREWEFFMEKKGEEFA